MLNKLLTIFICFLGTNTLALDFKKTNASAVNEIKKYVCDISSLDNTSKLDSRFIDRLRAEDSIYKGQCEKAMSFDRLNQLALERGDTCKEECSVIANRIKDIDQCRDECKKQAISIALRIKYFEKGMNSAIETDCGRQTSAVTNKVPAGATR